MTTTGGQPKTAEISQLDHVDQGGATRPVIAPVIVGRQIAVVGLIDSPERSAA